MFISSSTKDQETRRKSNLGSGLNIQGKAIWVDGNAGKALSLPDKTDAIVAGNIELYRKAFTLSAWIKIDQFCEGDNVALFGGQAPMGADQDTSGTTLHAGIQKKKLFMGFLGRDIGGDHDVPLGQWVNVTYTYNPTIQKGALYLNGQLDKTQNQKPYAGPLSTIGDSSILQHGSYAMSDVVVTQSCMTPGMIQLLYQKGLEAFQSGEFVSDWRPNPGALKNLEAVADIPDASQIAVEVETGDGQDKAIGSASVQLQAGQKSYSLFNLPEGQQVRLHVKLSGTKWEASPVLRSIVLQGANSVEWNKAHDWGQGTLSESLIPNYAK